MAAEGLSLLLVLVENAVAAGYQPVGQMAEAGFGLAGVVQQAARSLWVEKGQGFVQSLAGAELQLHHASWQPLLPASRETAICAQSKTPERPGRLDHIVCE